MNFDVKRQLQLGHAPQALSQDFFLNLKLVFVAGVLIVTSAAAGVVLAARLNAMQRGLEDAVCIRPREARLLLSERSLNCFLGEDERDEHGLAAFMGICGVGSSG